MLIFQNLVISFSGEADRNVVAYRIGWHIIFRDVLGISCKNMVYKELINTA